MNELISSSLTPRDWIKTVEKLITEYDAIAHSINNAILNDKPLSKKQVERVVQLKVAYKGLNAPDFYNYLDGLIDSKVKGNYESFNFKLKKLKDNLHDHNFKLFKPVNQQFIVEIMRNFNRSIWTEIMNKRFEVKNYFELNMNPNFERIDEQGVIKKRTNKNEGVENPYKDFLAKANNVFTKYNYGKGLKILQEINLEQNECKVEQSRTNSHKTLLLLQIKEAALMFRHVRLIYPLFKELELKEVFDNISNANNVKDLEQLYKKILSFENYNLFEAVEDYERYPSKSLDLGKENIINLNAVIKDVDRKLKMQVEKEVIDKTELIESQNKLITKVSISQVYEHFKVLTTKTNKNNEFYLTEDQLLIFIKSSFVDLKPIQQRFNCKGFVKKKVRKIFYEFYFNYKNKEGNETALKRKYFSIMNEAFEGFNSNDYTDFAK